MMGGKVVEEVEEVEEEVEEEEKKKKREENEDKETNPLPEKHPHILYAPPAAKTSKLT